MTEKDHVLNKKDEKMHCVSICLHFYLTFHFLLLSCSILWCACTEYVFSLIFEYTQTGSNVLFPEEGTDVNKCTGFRADSCRLHCVVC
jgi:hypothetical protein